MALAAAAGGPPAGAQWSPRSLQVHQDAINFLGSIMLSGGLAPAPSFVTAEPSPGDAPRQEAQREITRLR